MGNCTIAAVRIIKKVYSIIYGKTDSLGVRKAYSQSESPHGVIVLDAVNTNPHTIEQRFVHSEGLSKKLKVRLKINSGSHPPHTPLRTTTSTRLPFMDMELIFLSLNLDLKTSPDKADTVTWVLNSV